MNTRSYFWTSPKQKAPHLGEEPLLFLVNVPSGKLTGIVVAPAQQRGTYG